MDSTEKPSQIECEKKSKPEQPSPKDRLTAAIRRWLIADEAVTLEYVKPSLGRSGADRIIVLSAGATDIALSAAAPGLNSADARAGESRQVGVIWLSGELMTYGSLRYVGNYPESRVGRVKRIAVEKKTWEESGGVDYYPNPKAQLPAMRSQQLEELAEKLEQATFNPQHTSLAVNYLQRKWGAKVK